MPFFPPSPFLLSFPASFSLPRYLSIDLSVCLSVYKKLPVLVMYESSAMSTSFCDSCIMGMVEVFWPSTREYRVLSGMMQPILAPVPSAGILRGGKVRR